MSKYLTYATEEAANRKIKIKNKSKYFFLFDTAQICMCLCCATEGAANRKIKIKNKSKYLTYVCAVHEKKRRTRITNENI